MSFLSRQQKNHVKCFESAKSVEEKLKWFKKMESCFQESELGIPCFIIANTNVEDLEQVLSFGKRALRIFIANNDNNISCLGSEIFNKEYVISCRSSRYHVSAFYIAVVCHLLGYACFELNRLGECVSYFNWANRNLSSLLDHSCCNRCLLFTLHQTQISLLMAKEVMGRRDEVVVHALKILEIDEKTMEEGCIQLGETYKMVSEAYIEAWNCEQALPFACKALDIYTKHGVADDSAELAQVRNNLGTIYDELGEYDKALGLLRLSLNGLKSMESTSLWLNAQAQVASLLLGLGKYEEGVEAFKSLIPLVETEGDNHVKAVSCMGIARGLCKLCKFSDAKNYMKNAQRVFEKKEISPTLVASLYDQMSEIYEEMKDNHSAILYSRRALAIPEVPQNYLIEFSSRLFLLSSKNRKEKKGYSYLEEVVGRLKVKLGPEHIQVGCGYNTLGVSHIRSGQIETAAQCFARAKDVFDVSLSPHHLAALKATPWLVMTNANMDRIHQIIEIQVKVVENLKGSRPEEKGFLDEAVKLLTRMKESVSESLSNVSPQSKVGEE